MNVQAMNVQAMITAKTMEKYIVKVDLFLTKSFEYITETINYVSNDYDVILNTVLNRLVDTYEFGKHYIVETVKDIEKLPYQDYIDNSVQIIKDNSVLLSFFVVLFVIMLLIIILIKQMLANNNLEYMVNEMQTNEVLEILKLRATNISLQNEMEKKEAEISKLEKCLEIYRTLRTKSKGYFILEGMPSDRVTRRLMKDVDGIYLGKGQYLVHLDYIERFEPSQIRI